MIIGEDENATKMSHAVVRLSEYGFQESEYDTIVRFTEELRKRTGIIIECVIE